VLSEIEPPHHVFRDLTWVCLILDYRKQNQMLTRLDLRPQRVVLRTKAE